VPLVSAVIPVYNGASFIRESIESVLAQTWTDLECIVVDDGSTDGTAAAVSEVRDDRLRYVYQDNAGVAVARNRGIDEAKGAFVAFLDADDLWLPTKLERQLALFRERPELGLVVTGYTIVDEELVPRIAVLPNRRRLDLRRLAMLEASGIGLSFTGMVRADTARRLGFDRSYSTSADLEFALRVQQIHPIDAVVEPLALYRTHAGQMHLDLEAFERDTLRIFERWFAPGTPLASQRRRALGNLYTRLFCYELYRRQYPAARRALRQALRCRADRLVLLPLWALTTRSRKWIALRRLQATGAMRGGGPTSRGKTG
jgi:glycosyltransferase involved in cell wall biosynthesis